MLVDSLSLLLTLETSPHVGRVHPCLPDTRPPIIFLSSLQYVRLVPLYAFIILLFYIVHITFLFRLRHIFLFFSILSFVRSRQEFRALTKRQPWKVDSGVILFTSTFEVVVPLSEIAHIYLLRFYISI